MSAAADTDGSGFKSQGAYHHFQYPVCVVPQMIAPVQGHSKLQGAYNIVRTLRCWVVVRLSLPVWHGKGL